MAEEIKKGCDCGHEHEHEEMNDDIVMLEDEEGNEVPFHYITTIEHEGKEYVFLQSAEENGEEEEDDYLEIYEIETVEENGESFDNLIPVDDALYEVLYGLLMQQIDSDGECDCGSEDCEACGK